VEDRILCRGGHQRIGSSLGATSEDQIPGVGGGEGHTRGLDPPGRGEVPIRDQL
jgi:hypothetical protein